ncbi:DUF4430 domain-containing protein [Pseudogracilibacillus auburnensis]|uniref:DUF4430 domain-containing protein n=1 Tax=Pseudogracilibacillus auburnensis TaxID=1494959 RepID=UPI001A976B27|nr:DUF4430 domain-containing protein [Pseudogracilibacillus auburnensis]MBO1005542.1 DUF4430 domain-containing protein [Pseudogracilibacillus auburnensis]
MKKIQNLLVVLLVSLLVIFSACGNKEENVGNDQRDDQEKIDEISEEADGEDEIDTDENDETDEEEENNKKEDKSEDSEDPLQTKITKTKKDQDVTKDSTSTNNNNNKTAKNDTSSTTTKKSNNNNKSSNNSKTSKSNDTKKTSSHTNNKSTKSNSSSSSKNNQSAPKEKKKEEKVEQTVTVSVSIPSGVNNGSGLAATTVTINEGDTVLDASLKTGISIDYSGSGSTAYIKGINGLNEFDEGPLSGWLVKVDGSLINRSAGNYKVTDKQTIEWVYTTDYTK